METFLPLRAMFPVNFVEIVAKRKIVADGVLCVCVCVCVCGVHGGVHGGVCACSVEIDQSVVTESNIKHQQ